MSSKKMNGHEFKEKYNDITLDVKKILNKQSVTTNEEKIINILSVLKDEKTDEQPDTTNMPE